MSISSVSTSVPVAPVFDTSTQKKPDPQTKNDNNDAGAVQPPARAALPPGQGTRIDQLV
jgi:hypothetical protein